MWQLKEKSCASLTALNQYIAENKIEPKDVVAIKDIFETLKQQIRYTILYWVKK